MKKLLILVNLFLLSYSSFGQHEKYYPDPDVNIQNRLEEWRDLKFGLLMHWGPYSQWGVVESWSISPEDLSWAVGGQKKGVADNYFGYVKAYENLQTTFNPTKFNPEKWAAAKYAGMKYMVFTTKHHDGFSMFDTKYTDYKITDKKTPFSSNPRSNITKEVFNAFRNLNFWIGAYFSKPDWHSDYYWWKKFPPADRNANYSITKHPEQWKKFVDFTHNQIKELVTDYGQVDILWFDGGWVRKTTDEEVKKYLADISEGSRWARNPQNQDINMPGLVKEVRAKQPNILVVDRAVEGPEQNYLTPEQQIPAEPIADPWETCMTMGNSWSYAPNDVYKPAKEIIEKLVDIVSKGGNYLLNIGPDAEGEFDNTAYERLREIGDWMRVNGKAIYGTRTASKWKDGDKVRYTQSKDGKTKYVFLFEYPKSNLMLENLEISPKTKISMLGIGKKINWKKTDKGVSISVPQNMQSASKYVWVLEVKD